jgi:diaminohydroxyphosphoribosylaminopyrimidine deaminase / 5-amino-6-(5-phosphoribosylamino)uracil reductase
VILSHLYEQGIVSLIVEGGAHTLQQFIDANIWDEARILTGISEIKQGLKAPKIEGAKRKYDFGLDQVEIIENHISSNSSPT